MTSRVLSTVIQSAATTLLLGAIATGCTSIKPDNIRDPLYSECEREARILSEQDQEDRDFLDRPDMGSADQAIKDARAGHAEAEATGLAAWPVHALVVRCLAQNGIGDKRFATFGHAANYLEKRCQRLIEESDL